MKGKFSILGITLIALGFLAWAAAQSNALPVPQEDQQSWVGVVSDSHCGAKHSTASDEAASCVGKCVAGGSKYVLVSGDKVYQLDAQDKFAEFAGKSVKVTGKLAGDTINVSSVEGA